ncbi:MAG: PD-(D/E)XK nuclease family protein [Nitrospiraceae bacterium]|nr:PD-(D/E)XK nuclease family protein [Nitrospiraceae bacterium]
MTDRILRDAAGGLTHPDYSGILYIAPTPRKLRDAQRRFHRLVKDPYIPPRFSTLKQLARTLLPAGSPERIFADLLGPLLISEISGYAIGYARILSDILRELKQHYPLNTFEAAHSAIRGIFLLRGLPEDMLQRLEEAFVIFARYQSGLDSGGFIDGDDLLIRSASLVNALSPGFTRLLIDGFYDMTNAEINLVEALIGRADEVFVTFPYLPSSGAAADERRSPGYLRRLRAEFSVTEEQFRKETPPELAYVKYKSIEDEVEGTARHIKNLYIAGGIRPSDLVVLTAPKLQSYRPLFERVLTRYGIPFSMTARRPYAQQGPVRDLLHLIEAVADDYPRQKFTAFLNSPHFSKIPAILRRWIPSLSMKSGIVKGRGSWEKLNPDTAAKNIVEEVTPALRSVFALLEPLEEIRQETSAEVLHARIAAVMNGFGLTTGSDQQKQIDNALEMLHIVPELSGRETLPLARYAEFLRHILNTPEFAGESEGVQVMEFSETQGLEPDHLYFCGLKDGDMPSKPPLDHLIPDSVRRECGLSDLGSYLLTQKVCFERITSASAHRHLSYPSLEGDTVFLQSPYLPWGHEIQEKVFGILCEEELQTRKGFRPYESHITEISLGKKTLNRLLKKELAMPLRVTDVDAFRKCPRRFFLERILRLEAPGITEYAIEARLLGTIFHKVMELLFRDREGTGISQEGLQERAALIFDQTVRSCSLEPYWRNLLKAAFLEMLPKIIDLENEFRQEGFSPFDVEMDIKKEEVSPGISLRGKIDRIDTDGGTFRIIDYKTGTADIGSSVIKAGKGLQLPLYASMLRTRGMEVRKAGIYSLNTISVKWIPTSRDKYSMDDYIESALQYLSETVEVMRNGRLAAQPLDEFYCNSCAEVPFCPYIQTSPAPGAGNVNASPEDRA